MIRVVRGDLFESGAQTLVNTVNTVGVMGAGIALEFRRRFHENYQDYLRRCEAGRVRLGEPYLFRTLLEPWILNFPTKGHWRSVSRLSDIVAGLAYLGEHFREWEITSLAVPPLGCGHGQLEWSSVGPTLYRGLKALDIPVYLYPPHGASEFETTIEFLEGTAVPMDNRSTTIEDLAWAALADIVARIEKEQYHWPVGRITFQKVAYFATQEGLPTGLSFERGSFGPFSKDLKRVESRLVNNGLLSERPLGKMFEIRTGPAFPDVERKLSRELARWRDLAEKVADLFLRMKTKDAELAATVHFVTRQLQHSGAAPTEQDVLDEVKNWKQRRNPPLEEDEIAACIRNLNILGWIEARHSENLPLSAEAMAEA